MLKLSQIIYGVGFLLILASLPISAADEDPSRCLNDIQRVCAHMEDKIEICLRDRGDQLTESCRDQLKKAMALMDDPSGPATCIPDVQRLCPDLKAESLAGCMAQQQGNFSAACQNYLKRAHTAAHAE